MITKYFLDKSGDPLFKLEIVQGHSPYIVHVNVPGHIHEHPILLNTSCVLQSPAN